MTVGGFSCSVMKAEGLIGSAVFILIVETLWFLYLYDAGEEKHSPAPALFSFLIAQILCPHWTIGRQWLSLRPLSPSINHGCLEEKTHLGSVA